MPVRHMTTSSNRFLMLLVLLTLPLSTRAAPVSQQELSSVLHCVPDAMHGRVLFGTCSACHGIDGAGAPDGSVPAIAAQHYTVIVKELTDYRHDKRWDLRMTNFSGKHHLTNPQDIADVSGYVSMMPAVQSLSIGQAPYLEHGAELYAQRCASCHGNFAQGDGPGGYPRLARQHYAYLMRQMNDAVEHRRPNLDPDHGALLRRLEHDDFVGIAGYLSQLDHRDD